MHTCLENRLIFWVLSCFKDVSPDNELKGVGPTMGACSSSSTRNHEARRTNTSQQDESVSFSSNRETETGPDDTRGEAAVQHRARNKSTKSTKLLSGGSRTQDKMDNPCSKQKDRDRDSERKRYEIARPRKGRKHKDKLKPEGDDGSNSSSSSSSDGSEGFDDGVGLGTYSNTPSKLSTSNKSHSKPNSSTNPFYSEFKLEANGTEKDGRGGGSVTSEGTETALRDFEEKDFEEEQEKEEEKYGTLAPLGGCYGDNGLTKKLVAREKQRKMTMKARNFF